MGEDVYAKPFTLIACEAASVPPSAEAGRPLGRHLDGCRVGFDLGASDRKASAVIDGTAVLLGRGDLVAGDPARPAYHYGEILTAVKTAASKMPRLDAIGGSAAGVYVNDTVRVASLFRGVPKDRYDEVRRCSFACAKNWVCPSRS